MAQKYGSRQQAQGAANRATGYGSGPTGQSTVHTVGTTRTWAGHTRYTVQNTGQIANPAQRRSARTSGTAY